MYEFIHVVIIYINPQHHDRRRRRTGSVVWESLQLCNTAKIMLPWRRAVLSTIGEQLRSCKYAPATITAVKAIPCFGYRWRKLHTLVFNLNVLHKQ